jgi:CubicO group peptidase (beta-lactamase class C family)
MSMLFSACSAKKEHAAISGKDSVAPYHIPPPTYVSEKERQDISRDVQLFYDTLLDKSGFNGGILVAKNGNIIFEKYKGSINLNGKAPVTDSTPMHIASVSKTFTAMMILKLQEEGKLDIHDPLTKYFPGFNYHGVTIKTLLDHRSGLPNYLYFMEDLGWNKDSVILNKDVLQWLISKKDQLPNIAPPDRHFTYCNTNYALLALIIEKISGEPYPQFMQENIFTPLGMKHTFVHYAGDNRIRSKSFDWRGGEIPDNFLDAVYGDKNIYTTPRDLLIWDRALSDTVFLTAKSLDSAYTPWSNEKTGIRNYGLGWHMNIYPDGKTLIFHNGWWHGSNAAFIRPFRDHATIILISNRYCRQVYKAKYLVNIFEHYFDADEDSDNGASPAVSDSTAAKAKKPAARLKVKKVNKRKKGQR